MITTLGLLVLFSPIQLLAQIVAAKLPADAPRWPLPDGRVKTSAAWLIEHSGITKGQSIGGARISTKACFSSNK